MDENSPTYIYKFKNSWIFLLLGLVMTFVLIYFAVIIFIKDPTTHRVLPATVILLSFGGFDGLILSAMLSKLDIRVDASGISRIVFGQVIRQVKWQEMKEVTARVCSSRSYVGFLVVFNNFGLGCVAEENHVRRLPLIQTLNTYLLRYNVPVRGKGNFAKSDQITNCLPELKNESDYKEWCHSRGWG